jgi:ribosomal protein S6E (S10)
VGSDRRDNEKNTLARNKENHARNLPQAIDASTRRAFWMKRLKSGTVFIDGGRLASGFPMPSDVSGFSRRRKFVGGI